MAQKGIFSPKGRKFSSFQQLENALQRDFEKAGHKALEKVRDGVKQEMREVVDDFYSSYRPDYYTRTYQLPKAVEAAQSPIYKTKDGYKIRISLYNEDVMDQRIADWGFGSYADFDGHTTYGGKRYTEWVWRWIDTGSEREGWRGKRIWGHEPERYSKRINDYLDKAIEDKLIVELKRQGITREIF